MQTNYTQKDIARFWGKVEKRGPNDCWIWQAAKAAHGYGCVQWRKKQHLAHRVAFELSNGIHPGNLYVLHKCDTPSCVNPAHLFLGTQRDNGQDMARKKRSLRGEKNAASRLTEAQALEIRRRYGRGGKGGETLLQLARAFGVDQSQISNIVRGKKWSHLS